MPSAFCSGLFSLGHFGETVDQKDQESKLSVFSESRGGRQLAALMNPGAHEDDLGIYQPV